MEYEAHVEHDKEVVRGPEDLVLGVLDAAGVTRWKYKKNTTTEVTGGGCVCVVDKKKRQTLAKGRGTSSWEQEQEQGRRVVVVMVVVVGAAASPFAPVFATARQHTALRTHLREAAVKMKNMASVAKAPVYHGAYRREPYQGGFAELGNVAIVA